MDALTFFDQRFGHPLPGIVLLVGFGFWILATLWSVVGGVLSQVSSLTFAFVALLAAVIAAFGTVLIILGAVWYGLLLVIDLRTELRTKSSN